MTDIAITPGQNAELDKKLRRAGIKDHGAIQRLLDDPDKFQYFLDLLGVDSDTTSEENREDCRRDFGNLFDSQIQTLKDRGCPQVITDMLIKRRSAVLSWAGEMTCAEQNIPFLPVIPTTYLTIYSQMPMVRNAGNKGYVNLRPDMVFNVSNASARRPYYIFDVDGGDVHLATHPTNIAKAIDKQGRHGLRVIEVIALGIHTDVLQRHRVDAMGSWHDFDFIPSLFLYRGTPWLDCWLVDFDTSYLGSASCGSRLWSGS